jgi:hypothetical protein
MKTAEVLGPAVRRLGGVVLSGRDDELYVLDRSARGVLPLPHVVESPSGRESALALFTELHERGQKLAERHAAFSLDTTLEDILSSPALRRGVAAAIRLLVAHAECRLSIHFSQPPADWTPILRWLYRIGGACSPRRPEINLCGPFDVMDETSKEALFAMGAVLGFSAGWRPGCNTADALQLPAEAIRDLARYGFRIILVYYVHADSPPYARSIIREGLVLNEHSGFSVPVLFCHPNYAFDACQPALPSASAYSRLLSDIYHEFPCYDDVFFPINELAKCVGHGGWDGQADVPAVVRLAAHPESGLGMYRQVPSLARNWQGWDDLARIPEDIFTTSLLESHRKAFAWDENRFCGSCSWRYLCGGIDGWHRTPEPEHGKLAVGCEYRKVFLEVFAQERAQALLLNSRS